MAKRQVGIVVVLVAALSMVVSVATPSEAADPGGVITEYPVPGTPAGIAVGSDGNLWVTDAADGHPGILRVTTDGVMTEFPLPYEFAEPRAITAGPDSNLWFAEYGGAKIGRMTPTGQLTEFTVPTGNPVGITAGPDGNLWFTEPVANTVGKISTSGTMTEYSVPGSPGAITLGPDGNLWVGELSANKIVRLTTTGTISAEYSIPTPASGVAFITTGPDGKLWFTESNANKVASMTLDGQFTEYPTPTSGPVGIAAGPDGRLWLTLTGVNQMSDIAAVTTTGQFETFPIPTPDSGPLDITSGPDGNMWFTEYGDVSLSNGGVPSGSHNVGKIGTGPEPVGPPTPITTQPAFTG